MKRLFTFLGTGQYQNTTYSLDGRTCATPHFALALRDWFAYDEVTFFLTRAARVHENWLKTEQSFSSKGWRYAAVEIPDGGSEDELWEIFEHLTSSADSGDSVAFDITHGFRSLPLISVLAATFLRRAVGLDLEAIYYGAFEAKSDGVTPVFDLSPFLDLLQWLSGVEQFVGTGDSRPLAGLLKEIQSSAFRSGQDNPPKTLLGLGAAFQSLSLALALSRPMEVGDAASLCLERMEQANPDLNQGHARPLVPLLEQIRNTYAPLEDKTPLGQAGLIRWYLEREQTVQAVTLAREWMVGLACRLLHLDEIKARDEAEHVLNHAVFHKQGKPEGPPSAHLPNFLDLPSSDRLATEWSRARELRNDLAHCGFREVPLNGRKIVAKANALADAVAEFARQETD